MDQRGAKGPRRTAMLAQLGLQFAIDALGKIRFGACFLSGCFNFALIKVWDVFRANDVLIMF